MYISIFCVGILLGYAIKRIDKGMKTVKKLDALRKELHLLINLPRTEQIQKRIEEIVEEIDLLEKRLTLME